MQPISCAGIRRNNTVTERLYQRRRLFFSCSVIPETEHGNVVKLFCALRETIHRFTDAGGQFLRFRVLLVAQNMLDNPDNMKVLHANDMVRTAFILTGQGELLIDG